MNGEERNIQILKSLILCFKLVSGLKVNWNKTHLSGISIPELFITDRYIGYVHKRWPSKYLGLPLGGPRSKKNFGDQY